MPSACLLALTTITAAFQRMKARMRRSMCSSPGNHGSCSRRDGVDVRAWRRWPGSRPAARGPARAASTSRKRARVLPWVSTTASRRVEPLLRLGRIDVGQLVDEAVEDHASMSRTATGRTPYRPVGRVRAGSPVIVYTDGACSGNPGPGGWAWAVARRRAVRRRAASAHTTNQRMEITAALEAVRALDRARSRSSATRPTSSTASATAGGRAGRRNGAGATRRSKPVANRDLWEPLIELVRERGDVDLPLGEGPQRRPDERPRRPAGRRGRPAPGGSPRPAVSSGRPHVRRARSASSRSGRRKA